MDIQKEREAFEAWVVENLAEGRSMSWGDWCWKAWQAAKDQSVPEGYVVVPVNYECAWCGCTELDGWTDEAMLEAQEPK